ncbi:MAG: hypothetical protein H7039_10895, partial [Bryobacteraceae bacterium]|nr:hypothetical protein [Bryobacteraceae bacterium]
MPDFALPAKDAQQLAASPRGFGLRGRALVIVVPKLLNGLSVFAVNLYILSRLSPFEFGILTFAMTVVVTIDGLVNAAVDVAALKEATRARIQNILPVDSIEVAALLIKSCGWLAMLLVWLIAAISGGKLTDRPFRTPASIARAAGRPR